MQAMGDASEDRGARRNIALFPWFKAFQNLMFWQAVWFLFFQNTLSAASAILLYAVYDVATTILEVPSGYMSDRVGRRPTLIVAACAGVAGMALLVTGHSFAAFAAGQVLLGMSSAFVSGTDSAVLYESLVRLDRQDEIEAQELKAWRFGFGALAFSAAAGGLLTLVDVRLPFAASLLAMTGMLTVAVLLREPGGIADRISERARFAGLMKTFRVPVLAWLFALSVAMYAFSHVQFVFGQPFIQDALDASGYAAETPVVSGMVSAAMMVLSVATSVVARALRRGFGLSNLLLFAFGLQVALIGLLAITNSVAAIALLLLRMVPDALSRPFVLARIQPLLDSGNRATYLSMQSLAGRLVLAASLLWAASASSESASMVHSEIEVVLGSFAAAGVIALAVFFLTRRWGEKEG